MRFRLRMIPHRKVHRLPPFLPISSFTLLEELAPYLAFPKFSIEIFLCPAVFLIVFFCFSFSRSYFRFGCSLFWAARSTKMFFFAYFLVFNVCFFLPFHLYSSLIFFVVSVQHRAILDSISHSLFRNSFVFLSSCAFRSSMSKLLCYPLILFLLH